MDAQTCLQKLQLVGVLTFATVDGEGNPQIRCISAIHYDDESFYFFTAKGKNFCRELLNDGRVQILAYTRFKEMIRVSAKAVPVSDERQSACIDTVFGEQPYLANVYPTRQDVAEPATKSPAGRRRPKAGYDTRKIGIVFEIKDAQIEYFNLGVNPIFRETYTIVNTNAEYKGYRITDKCIACGTCQSVCPQRCIKSGTPFEIIPENCLHCGACFENCPVKAVERLG